MPYHRRLPSGIPHHWFKPIIQGWLSGFVFLFFPTLFTSLLPLRAAEADLQAQAIFTLVNERLGYMKDVVAYKRLHDKPVADRSREALVLESARKQAQQLGINPDSILPFLNAQINAAKAIQYRYLADWLATPLPENYTPADLDKVIRPGLIALDKKILEAIQQFLQAGHRFTPKLQSTFIDQMTADQLSLADKITIYQGLSTTRLSDSQASP